MQPGTLQNIQQLLSEPERAIRVLENMLGGEGLGANDIQMNTIKGIARGTLGALGLDYSPQIATKIDQTNIAEGRDAALKGECPLYNWQAWFIQFIVWLVGKC